jgi:dTDP-4-amino-4,6-dideoxygalactose transaminase
MPTIAFNSPSAVAAEAGAIADVIARGKLCGNGPMTRACQAALTEILGGGQVFLTHSCTAALEMAALLLDLKPGDEVILPSFTFPSTANPFVLRGAIPVFVDIRADTLNIDERLIEAAITPATRAICVIHYAGIAADMATIGRIAAQHGLAVIEDAAQALFASYDGQPLGTFGTFAAFSFHETKNIVAGEAGALVVNDPAFSRRAETIWEKGTNRADFVAGLVSKYTWVDVGSSFLPNELTAAFLSEQLREGGSITARRRAIWARYHDAFGDLEQAGVVRRPFVPDACTGNGHTYFLVLHAAADRQKALQDLLARGVQAAFHYVPLHDSPAGRRFGRVGGPMHTTEAVASRVLRLPLHLRLSDEDVEYVIQQVYDVFAQPSRVRLGMLHAQPDPHQGACAAGQ